MPTIFLKLRFFLKSKFLKSRIICIFFRYSNTGTNAIRFFPAHQFGNSKSQRAVSKNEVRNYFDVTCTYVQTLPNGHIIRHFAIFAYFKSNAIHIGTKPFLKRHSYQYQYTTCVFERCFFNSQTELFINKIHL